jgi:hypothetical protein
MAKPDPAPEQFVKQEAEGRAQLSDNGQQKGQDGIQSPRTQEKWKRRSDCSMRCNPFCGGMRRNHRRETNGLLWSTLAFHSQKPYVPHGVKMKYDGKPVDLTVAHTKKRELVHW